MTRKDYIAIARIIKEAAPAKHMPLEWSAGCDAACEYIARHLVDYLQKDNTHFKRAKFLAACK